MSFPFYQASYVAMAALAGYVGIQHLLLSRRRADQGGHRSFGLLGLSLSLHCVGDLYSQWGGADEGVFLVADWVIWISESFSLWALVSFVEHFTGSAPSRLLRWLPAVLTPFWLLLLVRFPLGFAYAQTPERAGWESPWGETIYHVHSHTTFGYWGFVALAGICIAHGMRLCWRAWRAGGGHRHLALLGALLLVVAAVANSILRDFGLIHSLTLIPHAFVALSLIMNVVLADEVARASVLQERLLQSERLEAVGRIAGGVAHDLINLQAVVATGAQLLSVKLAGTAESRAAADMLLTSQRASNLARRILEAVRRRPTENARVDVHEILNDIVAVLHSGMGAQIAVTLQTQAEDPILHGDATRLHSLFLNLALNARDAMPEGGVLRFSTRLASPSAAQRAKMRRILGGENHLEIEVADSGCGMTREVLDNLFKPFFTTKGEKGTGLGLAQVDDTLRHHRGAVLVESKPGEGTTFRIWLPRG